MTAHSSASAPSLATHGTSRAAPGVVAEVGRAALELRPAGGRQSGNKVLKLVQTGLAKGEGDPRLLATVFANVETFDPHNVVTP